MPTYAPVPNPNAADGQGQRAHEAQKQAQRDAHGIDEVYVLVEHVAADGALVAGREIVKARQGLLHLAHGVVAE